MTYSKENFNLPEFNAEIYDLVVGFGCTEEEALDVAIEGKNQETSGIVPLIDEYLFQDQDEE